MSIALEKMSLHAKAQLGSYTGLVSDLGMVSLGGHSLVIGYPINADAILGSVRVRRHLFFMFAALLMLSDPRWSHFQSQDRSVNYNSLYSFHFATPSPIQSVR